MHRIRAFLKFAGKGERKVAVVFGIRPEHCDRAVRHLRKGAPDLPVWLFAGSEPWPETAALCERVAVEPGSVRLLLRAQAELWPWWVALAVTTWTGEHGRWPLKLAPFLVPPFRALVMNAHGDFFAPRPAAVARHFTRGVRDFLHSSANGARDLCQGVWLWFFALAAQHFSALSRRAFRHGTAPLALPPCPPQGEGVAVYRYRHRHWDREEVERLVHSDCRRILFLEGDAQEAPPWVEDDQTFAVSRQAGFRAWKPCMFATAPFRQLQQGEISRTLAPVSNAILADRAKLAALGIPKTVVPGSAWLILFWKAAAAGWNSYSAGGSAPLEEQPDWPYEEAEFVTHILSDPDLRALGPRDPALKRGAIATALTNTTPSPISHLPSPAAAPAAARVLILSPYLPYPLSHGGAVRIWNLCGALAGRVDFVLACFREKGDTTDYAKLSEVFREVYIVDRDEHAVEDSALPQQVRGHASAAMRALVAELAPRIDLLQVEFTHMAAFRDAAPAVPAILVEHDLTFTLYRQFAGQQGTAAAREEYERWLAFERAHFQRYDAVWTMSDEDRTAALAEGSPAGNTWVVANGVDLARFTPGDEETPAPEIFYVGSFRHLPNIIGFEALRDEVMPRVWKRFPTARLRVVAGPEPQRYWREFRKAAFPRAMDSRIEMHGFVADLRPLYAKAALVVVPLVVSAGTNIKVMEAMACRKAVVTTPVGCQGLGLQDGCDALIRAEWPEFADAVGDLLADPELRARIAAAARATVESAASAGKP